MYEIDREGFHKFVQDALKKPPTKKEAIAFFIRIGVMTRKGKLRKRWKDLPRYLALDQNSQYTLKNED